MVKDKGKTKEQLIRELSATRSRIAEFEKEELLRSGEIKFRALTESSASAILLLQGRQIIYINPSFETMIGYSIGELSKMNYWDIVHPDFRELVKQRALARQRGENVPSRYEMKVITKAHKEKWIDITAAAIDFENRPTILASGFDVTERKEAEEALRQSEKLYRSVIENIPDTFYRADMRGNLTMMSPSGKALFGYDSVDALIGCNVAEILYVNPEDRKQLLSALERQGSVKDYEVKLKRRDGTVVDISTSSHLCFDEDNGVALGIEGILRDISRRKLGEESLRCSEERFSKAFRMSPAPTIMSTIHGGRYIDVNDAFLRMLGYAREEMIGRTAFELDVWANYDDRQTVARKLGEEGSLQGEMLHLRTKNGDIRDVLVSAEIITLSGENLILSIFYDVTDQKRLEAQLQRAQKMEAIGTLAGGVAHDLNNVMGVLVGYSEMLKETLPEGGTSRKYADNILQSGLRGAAIIQDLLTLARRGVSVSKVVNLNGLISDHLRIPEFEKLKAYHPDVKILTELAEGLLNIKGSPVHLSKAVMNLISNAAESITGHGQITIRTENRHLDRPVHGYDSMQEGDYAVLTISDTGSGISAEDLRKIFEPFYTKKVMGRSGTGLGLTVVWGTVKDHNGYIDVQSEEGKGTTFTLYFPVTRDEPEKGEKPVSRGAYMGRGESILVVDDVKEQRELAMSMLTGLGYQVAAVSGGETAIEYIKKQKADLILLDMIMDPGIDGMETYRRIHEISPKQKAIIVSGFAETDRVRKTQAMGAGVFVRKPYIMETIGLAIRQELDRK